MFCVMSNFVRSAVIVWQIYSPWLRGLFHTRLQDILVFCRANISFGKWHPNTPNTRTINKRIASRGIEFTFSRCFAIVCSSILAFFKSPSLRLCLHDEKSRLRKYFSKYQQHFVILGLQIVNSPETLWGFSASKNATQKSLSNLSHKYIPLEGIILQAIRLFRVIIDRWRTTPSYNTDSSWYDVSVLFL